MGFKIGKTKAKKYIYTPEDKDELIDILRKRLQKHSNADLNYIDTSKITDMSYLFLTFDPGNIDISGWDVSNVTNMSFMFTQGTFAALLLTMACIRETFSGLSGASGMSRT